MGKFNWHLILAERGYYLDGAWESRSCIANLQRRWGGWDIASLYLHYATQSNKSPSRIEKTFYRMLTEVVSLHQKALTIVMHLLCPIFLKTLNVCFLSLKRWFINHHDLMWHHVIFVLKNLIGFESSRLFYYLLIYRTVVHVVWFRSCQICTGIAGHLYFVTDGATNSWNASSYA